jgi:hypothetical protein
MESQLEVTSLNRPIAMSSVNYLQHWLKGLRCSSVTRASWITPIENRTTELLFARVMWLVNEITPLNGSFMWPSLSDLIPDKRTGCTHQLSSVRFAEDENERLARGEAAWQRGVTVVTWSGSAIYVYSRLMWQPFFALVHSRLHYLVALIFLIETDFIL